jgi:hypothetical protein
MRANSSTGSGGGLAGDASLLQQHAGRLRERYDSCAVASFSYADLLEEYGVNIEEELALAGIIHRGRKLVCAGAAGSLVESAFAPDLHVYAFPGPPLRVENNFVDHILPYAGNSVAIQLRKMDVYMPAEESFRICDNETRYRFLRGEIKTARLLGGKTCSLCGGDISHTSEVVHAANASAVGAPGCKGLQSPSHKDSPPSPPAGTAFRRVQGALQHHTCSFFSIALASNKTCDTLRIVICFVRYGFDYGGSRVHAAHASPVDTVYSPGPGPPGSMPTPVVLMYTVTPAVMMAACCSVLCLADTMLQECLEAQLLSRAEEPGAHTRAAARDDGSLDFLLESHVDVHSLQRTVEFCVSVVLRPFYDSVQQIGAKNVLQKVGEALLKHGSARPLVKPFVSERVQGVDMTSHYVKNPTHELMLQLQKTRIFTHAGASRVAPKGPPTDHSQQPSPIAHITGLPAEQLAALLVPWTALHTARFETIPLWTQGDRALVLQSLLDNTDLVQLLYAVRCFLHQTQRVYYAEELGIMCVDTLDRYKMMEIQIRFLNSFLDAVAPLRHCQNFDKSDTMRIVARVAQVTPMRL